MQCNASHKAQQSPSCVLYVYKLHSSWERSAWTTTITTMHSIPCSCYYDLFLSRRSLRVTMVTGGSPWRYWYASRNIRKGFTKDSRRNIRVFCVAFVNVSRRIRECFAYHSRRKWYLISERYCIIVTTETALLHFWLTPLAAIFGLRSGRNLAQT